jgi:hypothetical protein
MKTQEKCNYLPYAENTRVRRKMGNGEYGKEQNNRTFVIFPFPLFPFFLFLHLAANRYKDTEKINSPKLQSILDSKS